MAAHSFLRIGGLWIFAYREWYSETLASVFRDDENVSSIDAPCFTLRAGPLKSRLNVLGFTSHIASGALQRAFKVLEESGELEEPSFDVWLEQNVRAVTNDEVAGDEVPGWLYRLDEKFALRRILDFVEPDVEVSLDLSEVVLRGFVPPSATLCADALSNYRANDVGPLVVLTEGSSDIEAVSASLDLLLPHLSGYVKFLDYTLKPEGSAAAQVRAIRAFAAAGIQNNMVALFDNDTAACEALTSLNLQTLPRNFRVLQLPSIALAGQYPTIGPAGGETMDINGLAVSIELFFGSDVLEKTGVRIRARFQWTGYSSKMGAYQGEIMNKSAIQARFKVKVHQARLNGLQGQDWTAMRLLLDAIATAFD